MGVARAGGVVGQDLLAREGLVVAAVALEAVGVADVVAVFFGEFVVGGGGEGGAPECDGLVGGEADALEEEGVLEAAKML